MIERMPDYVSGYTKWGSAISLVDSCDFVDGLLRSQNIRSVKSHEITPTKPQGKLSHHSIPAAQTV